VLVGRLSLVVCRLVVGRWLRRAFVGLAARASPGKGKGIGVAMSMDLGVDMGAGI
jgi:hypothetical protein